LEDSVAPHPDLSSGPGADSSGRTFLQVELHTGERQVISTFRESFLRWLNDRNGPLSRLLGAADLLSIDEVPPAPDARDRSTTLRLKISWTRAHVQRGSGSPRPGPHDTAVPELFKVFPDELQDSPLRHVPIAPAAVTPAAPRAPHAVPPPKPRIASRVSEGVRALTVAARRATADWHAPRFDVRVPVPLELKGLRSIVTLGTAAAVIGFMVGALFLSEIERPPHTGASAARLAGAETHAPAVGTAGLGIVPPSVETAPAAPVSSKAVDRQPAARADKAVATSGKAASSNASKRRSPEDVITSGSAKAAPAPSGGSRLSGALLVTSDPQGAEISINGVVKGKTPMLIRGLAAGSRVVRLDLPGYEPWSWSVRVAADTQTPVTVKLHREPRGSQQ
jgi:hypothetical protein